MCYLRRQSRDPDLGRQIKTFEFRLDSRQYGAKLAVRLREMVFAWSWMLVGCVCVMGFPITAQRMTRQTRCSLSFPRLTFHIWLYHQLNNERILYLPKGPVTRNGFSTLSPQRAI